uniref:Guanine nucleotide-binding protein subunit alpha n=1 Tax=Ganoderma boninense TaxID=34458 RepID=A0A5K1JZ02_9APHY|nr:Guanine nucleotide-binding protein subunit alpha [Ganoderma boninense]
MNTHFAMMLFMLPRSRPRSGTPQIAYTAPATSATKPATFDVTIAAGMHVRAVDINRNALAVGTTSRQDGAISGRSYAVKPVSPPFLCRTTICVDCPEVNLNFTPHNLCIPTDVEVIPGNIDQPAAEGVPSEVVVG